MQRAEYKVSRFGCGYGCGNCFKVTHFSYEDNVRVFTESGSEG